MKFLFSILTIKCYYNIDFINFNLQTFNLSPLYEIPANMRSDFRFVGF